MTTAQAGHTTREEQASVVLAAVRRAEEQLAASLGETRALATKVAAVHGAKEPALQELGAVVEELVERVPEHLAQERRALEACLAAPAEPYGPASLAATVEEHRRIEALLDRTRLLTDRYAPPPWACRTLTRCFSSLAALDDDLSGLLALEARLPLDLEVR